MKFETVSALCETRLILDASEGDLAAFNYFVLKYQDLAFSYAFGLLGDRYSAEDAAQESFIKAFQNINKFRGSSFRAWLLRIVINTCYDEMRWSKRHQTIPLILDDEDCEGIDNSFLLADLNTNIQIIVERKELSSTLFCLLDELPGKYRNPIILIDFHELDYLEAAQVLEIPLGTLKSRLARARVQMKEKLQRKFVLPGVYCPVDAGLVA